MVVCVSGQVEGQVCGRMVDQEIEFLNIVSYLGAKFDVKRVRLPGLVHQHAIILCLVYLGRTTLPGEHCVRAEGHCLSVYYNGSPFIQEVVHT